MIDAMIGQKLGMTQIYTSDGKLVPVTVVEAGPCQVICKKTVARDGYDAVQISFGQVDNKRLNKPEAGHFASMKGNPARHLREVGASGDVEVGSIFHVDVFEKGQRVDVSGISRGKGFAGVMKRHHFRGGPATHGSMFHREPGSIGASSYPSRVWKNQRMPGHMGAKKATILSQQVVEVRKDENLIFIMGATPGAPGSLLMIRKSTR
jgi:large subunit ribosomal protein L3